jgi:Tfp pilus assembly protein FimT
MELMVVLTLVAILSVAIVPEMKGGFEDAVLKASARQVIDLCNLANSRAVALGQVHRVRYVRSSRQWIVELQTSRSPRGGSFSPVRELQGSNTRGDPRIQLHIRTGAPSSEAAELGNEPAPTAEGIAFYPDGTSDTAVIELTDRAGVKLELRLNPVTARFRKVERTVR